MAVDGLHHLFDRFEVRFKERRREFPRLAAPVFELVDVPQGLRVEGNVLFEPLHGFELDRGDVFLEEPQRGANSTRNPASEETISSNIRFGRPPVSKYCSRRASSFPFSSRSNCRRRCSWLTATPARGSSPKSTRRDCCMSRISIGKTSAEACNWPRVNSSGGRWPALAHRETGFARALSSAMPKRSTTTSTL